MSHIIDQKVLFLSFKTASDVVFLSFKTSFKTASDDWSGYILQNLNLALECSCNKTIASFRPLVKAE